jgi:hypothetical protein
MKISCTINTTNADCELGMEIWLNDDCVFNDTHIKNQTLFEHVLSDLDAEHQLRFVLKGKKSQHTQISNTGEILHDARLTISDLSFDEILLDQIFFENAVYKHNFNGNGPETQQKFYGEIGCNGVVELNFSTPMYLWLLENM